ncbi:MAG TPA: hypothetical protein VN025_05860 [Candidatus Dormibacteraeota bacterium]|jgi:hypothetical protein|nr:hypothetical protein [Candidatus Dormibacteraeota bacterium]
MTTPQEPAKTTTGWNDQQEQVIAMYQEKLGMSRSNAIRKLRGQELRGITPAQILAAPSETKLKQVQEKPKAKAKVKPATPKATVETYDKELVIRLFERDNMTPTEIAAAADKYAGLRKGNKKISAVYIGRILWGQQNSGGVSPEQKERRKLRDERDAKAKKEAEAK